MELKDIPSENFIKIGHTKDDGEFKTYAEWKTHEAHILAYLEANKDGRRDS